MISAAQREFWDENGYLIVEGVLSQPRLEAVRAALEARFAEEGDAAGSEGSDNPGVRRLCNLFSKGQVFEELGTEPIALEMAHMVIGDDIRWQAMNFHDPLPHDPRCHQTIHADRAFFPMAAAYLNVIWVLDDMTAENGATRLVPGSHKRPWPLDLDDPKAPVPGEIFAECPAGSVVFVHGDTWHGGRANYTDSLRRAIHMGFACPATPPQYELGGAISDETRNRLGAHAALIPKTLAEFGLEQTTQGHSIDSILVVKGAFARH